MNTVERFNTWQLVGIGIACWFLYAWLVWPLWAEYQHWETRIAVYVVHAAVAVGLLIWRGWMERQPQPMEEDSDAAA